MGIATTGCGRWAFLEAATPNVLALDYVNKPFELMDMLDSVGRSPDRIHSQREAASFS